MRERFLTPHPERFEKKGDIGLKLTSHSPFGGHGALDEFEVVEGDAGAHGDTGDRRAI